MPVQRLGTTSTARGEAKCASRPRGHFHLFLASGDSRVSPLGQLRRWWHRDDYDLSILRRMSIRRRRHQFGANPRFQGFARRRTRRADVDAPTLKQHGPDRRGPKFIGAVFPVHFRSSERFHSRLGDQFGRWKPVGSLGWPIFLGQ